MSVPTPHIAAHKGDFAKTVIMPGDPKRAELIAEKYLDNPHLISSVRGISAYTGMFDGKTVSVMASGMGAPSMGIYSYELFKFYDVDKIIRVGSAGAISDSLKLRDIVIAASVSTDSNFASQYNLPGGFAPCADFNLIWAAVSAAHERALNIFPGNVLSSDVFYAPMENLKKWKNLGVLAVEMESYALYCNAAYLGKSAITLCTISDLPFKEECCDSEEREKTFTDMLEIALDII